MIRFDSQICQNLQEASAREWLETNGIGGFASGTIAGINTRRYHGWLVAATNPPVGRHVLLSKIEERVTIDGKAFELSANQYTGAIHPQGYNFLRGFELSPFPTWIYQLENVEIEKTVFMPDGENTVVCEYKFKVQDSRSKVQFELRPLLAFRDYHHLRSEEESYETDFREHHGDFVSVQPYAEMPRLYFMYRNGVAEKTGFWYRNFEYEVEHERGFDFRENLHQPFALKFEVSGSNTQSGDSHTIPLIVSTVLRSIKNTETIRRTELERRNKLVAAAGYKDEFLRQLVLDSEQFIVSRGSEKSVIAGYHWFSDWGRDTMIALPGLTLATNRPEIARSVLLEFSRHVSDGMLPNRFPDAGDEPEYNTVDATLWYFEAVRAYLEKTGDYDFVERDLYEKLVEIVVRHLRGTRYRIHVDTDGLLWAGEDGTQLTWMDAKSGDTVFTPRVGKAVEIQALWYNALCTMRDLAEKFGDEAGKHQYAAIAETAKTSFNQNFWNEAEGCLFDVINGERDASVRPNQIFAVSLKHSLLDLDKAQKVVRKVEQELLTPVGLRSLSPRDPKYQGRYEGNGFERDSAYHQGTVWAWLAGAYLTAYAKVFAGEPDTEQKLNAWLAEFQKHLPEAGAGQISEIFDGDPPHAPRGCIAQAWSVAEILRATAEIKKR